MWMPTVEILQKKSCDTGSDETKKPFPVSRKGYDILDYEIPLTLRRSGGQLGEMPPIPGVSKISGMFKRRHHDDWFQYSMEGGRKQQV